LAICRRGTSISSIGTTHAIVAVVIHAKRSKGLRLLWAWQCGKEGVWWMERLLVGLMWESL
jgi:hypothetical protein